MGVQPSAPGVISSGLVTWLVGAKDSSQPWYGFAGPQTPPHRHSPPPPRPHGPGPEKGAKPIGAFPSLPPQAAAQRGRQSDRAWARLQQPPQAAQTTATKKKGRELSRVG